MSAILVLLRASLLLIVSCFIKNVAGIFQYYQLLGSVTLILVVLVRVEKGRLAVACSSQ